MPQEANRNPKVFISYSHDDGDHRARVLELANKLRSDKIDAEIDQYYEDNPPPKGWPRWMERQLREADFVLCVCTPTYKRRFEDDEAPEVGLGVAWESGIIYAAMHAFKGHNTRFIPILHDAKLNENIPVILSPTTRLLPWTADGYDALKRRIDGTPKIVKPPLGAAPAPSRAAAPPPSAAPARGTNIPLLGPNIVARPHETAVLRALLHVNLIAGVIRPAAVTAPGGFGKTITAQLYAHEYASDYPGGRFFLRCEQGNIQTELAALARFVGVDESLPDPEKAARVKAALESGPLALLVLDNVTDAPQWTDEAFRSLLPATNVHLLVTSRASIEKAIAIESKHFSPDHPTFAIRYNNLAHICKDEGDRAAAYANFKKALAIFRNHFDEDHPHVKTVRTSMQVAGCGE